MELDNCKLASHLFGGFETKARSKHAEKILHKLRTQYGEPECGRNRASFMLKKHVLKFPLNNAGEADNDLEGSMGGPTLAKGRRIEIEGFICVVQEKLDVIDDPYGLDLPEWVNYIDGSQVGYSAKGVLKAYDFGRH
jgi:hypothetical protein